MRKEKEKVRKTDIWGKRFLGIVDIKCKLPQEELVWYIKGTRRPVGLEQNERQRSGR